VIDGTTECDPHHIAKYLVSGNLLPTAGFTFALYIGNLRPDYQVFR